MVALAIIGVCFIYSVQQYKGDSDWYSSTSLRQVIFLLLGAALYVAVASIDYKFFLKYAHILYFLSVLLLISVETPLGVERFNARRWLNFHYVLYQPSEAVKVGVLIMIASVLARCELESFTRALQALGKIALIVVLPIGLIFRQPDLGSALVLPPMIFSLLYVSTLSKRFFGVVFTIFAILMGILSLDLYRYYDLFQEEGLSFSRDKGQYEEHSWLPLKDYQRNRLLAFVAPEVIDPRGTGVSWNRKQSLISVGSGGLIGKGHGEGNQARLGYLPQSVAHNDFIFSVIAEEKGFWLSSLVILLFAMLLFNNLRIASVARDRFGMLLVVGVSTLLLVHIVVNIGMTIGFMPITGLPLPLVSYGGSFVLSCCFLQGLVQSVYRCRRNFS